VHWVASMGNVIFIFPILLITKKSCLKKLFKFEDIKITGFITYFYTNDTKKM